MICAQEGQFADRHLRKQLAFASDAEKAVVNWPGTIAQSPANTSRRPVGLASIPRPQPGRCQRSIAFLNLVSVRDFVSRSRHLAGNTSAPRWEKGSSFMLKELYYSQVWAHSRGIWLYSATIVQEPRETLGQVAP